MAKPGELDFKALAEQAAVELEKEPSTKEVISETEPTVTTEELKENVETTSESTNLVDTKTEPVVQAQKTDVATELSDDSKVKIKVDGEEQVVTYKEYKDILRKNATITQRMQTFAKERDQFNEVVNQRLAEIEARERAIREMSEKKDPLYDTILTALKNQINPQEKRNPNDIVTLAEIEAERKRLREEFESMRKQDRESFETQLVEAAQAVQTQAQRQRERQAYLNGLDSILKQDSLKDLLEISPNLAAETMFYVQKNGAQNLEEALELSREFVEDRFKKFESKRIAKEQKQQEIAAKQKMESNDGATPTIMKKEQSVEERRKKFVGKNGKLDWNAMMKDSLAKMNSMN